LRMWGAERASITCWERGSDSPYVESIMHGRTLSDDSPTRPAECHWHMVFVGKDGEARVVFVWERRTAIVSTSYFIRQGDAADRKRSSFNLEYRPPATAERCSRIDVIGKRLV
jgi:hypothetical protein